MRASLLAKATASLFLCNRSDAFFSHVAEVYIGASCAGRIRSTLAPWINSVRKFCCLA